MSLPWAATGSAQQYQVKRCRRLLEIPALVKRHAVREFIAMKCVAVKNALKRQGFTHSFRSVSRDGLRVRAHSFCANRTLLHLGDLSFSVDKKGSRKSEIPAPVKQVAKGDVVNAGQLWRGQQNRE